jgi:hypothetical protein
VADFDLEGARKEGYSDAEIAKFLADDQGFDYPGATKEGYSDTDIIQYLTASADTAAAVEPPPPPPGTGLPSRIVTTTKKAGKAAATWFSDKRLKPLAAILGDKMDPATTVRYAMENGLEDAIAKLPTDPEAVNKQIRDNMVDLALTSLDVSSLGFGGPVNIAIRNQAAKFGLKGALERVLSTAVEGGGYGAVYGSLESAIEGDSLGRSIKNVLGSTAMGAGAGAVLGGAVVGIQRLFKRIHAENQTAKQVVDDIATGQQQREAASAAILAENPHIGEPAAQRAAVKVVRGEIPPEKLAMQEPLPAPKPTGGVGTSPMAQDEETAKAMDAFLAESAPEIPPVVISERATSVPYAGSPELRPYVRATASKHRTIGEHVRDIKNGFGALFTAEPGAGNKVAGILFRARQELSAAQGRADHLLDQRIFSLLQGNRRVAGQKSALLSDYAHAMDRASTIVDLTRRGEGEVPVGGAELYGSGVGPRVERAVSQLPPGPTEEQVVGGITTSVQKPGLALPEEVAGYPAQGSQVVGGGSRKTGTVTVGGMEAPYFKPKPGKPERVTKIEGVRFGPARIRQAFRALGPGGTTYEQWKKEAEALGNEMARHPDVVQAYKALRNVTDEMHETMVQYGLLDPGQYRESYKPAQRLLDMATGLEQRFAGTAIGRELSAAMQRNAAGEIVETNLVKVMRASLHALNRKVAEIELWRKIEMDPDLNLTRFFEPGQPIPKGLKLYRPGKGMPGYQEFDAMDGALQAAIEGLPTKSYTQGAYVLSEDLANRLMHFYQATTSPVEQTIYKYSRMYARQLTLYSPSNTPLNAMSDTPLAMLGMPGEANNLFGFIRFLPVSVKESFRGAFGKQSDLFERAMEEGLTGTTFIQSVGGETVPRRLEAAMMQGKKLSPIDRAKDVAANWVRVRQAVELFPRMAGGLAAEAKSGQAADFARVGEMLTLPYGAGDPAVTRAPIMNLLAPFWRWTGLAAERSFRLATTKGSRARGIAALAIPPMAVATWNLRNPAFRKVEYSLSQYDRTHMHVILPDPSDPEKPMRKKNGQPMVWRMRFWVPEEIAGFFGIGNLPGRIVDVAAGYNTPLEAIKEGASEVGENIASVPVAIMSARQMLTGRSNLTGQQLESFERTETTLPLFYHVGKFFETMENEGLGAAAAQAPGRIVGIRPAGARLGRADAKIQNLVRQIRESEMKIRIARSKGDKRRIEFYINKIHNLQERLRRTQAGKREIEGTEAP